MTPTASSVLLMLTLLVDSVAATGFMHFDPNTGESIMLEDLDDFSHYSMADSLNTAMRSNDRAMVVHLLEGVDAARLAALLVNTSHGTWHTRNEPLAMSAVVANPTVSDAVAQRTRKCGAWQEINNTHSFPSFRRDSTTVVSERG